MYNDKMGKVVSELTTDEKILLTSGKGAWHTYDTADIPSVMMTDGPHGLRKEKDNAQGINDSVKATCFPTACAVASSWNKNNAALIAECIAEEAVSEGVSVVLGPGVNIKRSPLCGRNFEYFSEDPVLSAHLAQAYVDGMQGKSVGSCLKHFAVNSQETRRMTVDAIVDERALREIYLSAFEYVVKNSQPYAVMASYNKINGVYATENKHLLTDILRDEWGFKGIVMSDWGASYNTAKAISAGMDLEMPEDKSGYHRKAVEKAIDNGELSVDKLDGACERVLSFVDRCGKNVSQPSSLDKHHAVCCDIAADCAVLLKNDGLLPISCDDDYCVIGELAEFPRFQGGGSSHINTECNSFLKVLSENNCEKAYAKGYSVQTDSVDKSLQKQAVKLASKHKVVLFFGGLTDIYESEGYDRTHLKLPRNQTELLKKLYAVNKNIVFVAFGGAPFEMPWLDNVKALLNMYLGGEAVMEGAYKLLFGKVSPSGRLAETYPKKLEDTPCYNYFANDRFFDEHRESIFVGYRYYNTFGVQPLFPFGYGLSYSEFEYSQLTAQPTGNGFIVSVTVKNVGNMPASEVVQLYVDNCDGNIMRAKRELKGFEKVFLQVGQSQTVRFSLNERDFAVYKKDLDFVTVNGEYGISVCKNVNEAILTKKVSVNFGVSYDTDDRRNYPCYFDKPEQTFVVADEQFYDLTGWYKPKIELPLRGKFTLLNTLEDLAEKVGLCRIVLKYVKKEAKKRSPSRKLSDPVAQMTISGAKQTPLISLMSIGGIDAKYVMFLLYHANKRYVKALKALKGKYTIE